MVFRAWRLNWKGPEEGEEKGEREGGREEWKMEGEKNRREKESRMCVLGEKGREGLTF